MTTLRASSTDTQPTTTESPAPNRITISSDGNGTFKTIQDAVNAIPAYPYEIYEIHILPGIYHEQVTIPRLKPHIHFKGDDAAKTVITFGLGARMPGPDGKPIGTFKTPTVSVLADDFTAENITFENSLGPHGQALAIEVAGDRVAFDHCRFLGWQDTIFADSDGRNYFHDCYVEGHVDFIFGKSTAVFDQCEIHAKDKGFLTAASTTEEKTFGYVFLNCKLTADKTVAKGSVFLGRPWRPYAAVCFLDCEMGEHINSAGWNDWQTPARQATARFAEYGNTRAGATPDQRVHWMKALSADEAKDMTIEKILEGSDHWQPLATDKQFDQNKLRPVKQ